MGSKKDNDSSKVKRKNTNIMIDGKTKLSFRLYLICLVLCLSFFVTDLMVSIDFVLRTCAQSTVVKV